MYQLQQQQRPNHCCLPAVLRSRWSNMLPALWLNSLLPQLLDLPSQLYSTILRQTFAKLEMTFSYCCWYSDS